MVELRYGLLDITAADDAVSSCAAVQPFANPQDINTPDLDTLPTTKYATLEQNLWLLDGSFPLFPADPSVTKWGLWSKEISEDDGRFAQPVVLTLDFDENHTSEGLTMYFRGDTYDYPSEMHLAYYDGNLKLLYNKTYYPDAATYFAESPVADYKKIVITFRGTHLPRRYLKLSEIKYGSIKVFGDDEVIEASIYEETDVTGAELAINTLTCTLYAPDFNLLDPQGIYKMLQQKQAINAATIDGDGKRTEYGTFFLDEPSSDAEDTVTLECVDLLGVIDKTDFLGGIYFEKNAAELIGEIMESAGVELDEYEIMTEIGDKTLGGWLPICTHREALQQVAFALGAVVDCSRGKKIRIYTPGNSGGLISHDDKILGHTVALKALVTGVEVTTHKYSKSAELSRAYEGTLTSGVHTLTFDAPYTALTVTGATLLDTGANYATISVSGAKSVTLEGYKYEDSTGIVGAYLEELPANTKPNVVAVDEAATLIDDTNAKDLAVRLLERYQNRYTDEGEIVLGAQHTGETWTLNSQNGRDLFGTVDSLDIDLVTELAEIKITGKSVERTE